MPSAVPRLTMVCCWCGRAFGRLPSALRQHPARHCSRACLHADWVTRFWDRAEPGDGDDDCWRWTGPTAPDGHARFVRRDQRQPAARVAYLLTYGTLPAGHDVRPRCGDPLCVRPDHLATVARGDGPPARPPDAPVPSSALTWATVATIRARYASGGIQQQALAAEYGLSPGQMSRLLRGESWRSGAPHPRTAPPPFAADVAPDPRSAATQARLADALRALVAADGAATPAALAARAGVARQTVDRHWAALLAATGLVAGRRAVTRGGVTREERVALAAPGEER